MATALPKTFFSHLIEGTILFVFGVPEYWHDQEPIQYLMDAYPQAKMIGCSTAGEIHGGSIEDHSLSVAVVKFNDTFMEQTFVEIHAVEDSFTAGETIANDLNKRNLQGDIFYISKPLSFEKLLSFIKMI